MQNGNKFRGRLCLTSRILKFSFFFTELFCGSPKNKVYDAFTICLCLPRQVHCALRLC